MPTEKLPQLLLSTLKEHISPGAEWVPLAAAGAIALIGLVFMVKGARLAPLLAALALGALGSAAGSLAARGFDLPFWPALGGGTALGLILGVLLFRVWLALLVGACLAAVSLGVYGTQVLRGPLDSYLSAGLDRERQLVTLPDASSPAANWRHELSGLWSHLGSNVPNFQMSVWAIVASTGLAGLAFGLLLPKLARAFWAASVGTGLLVLAACAAVKLRWPDHATWLQHEGLTIAAGLWLISLAYNWVDVRGIRMKKNAGGNAQKAPA
jgi:hypothetical protein